MKKKTLNLFIRTGMWIIGVLGTAVIWVMAWPLDFGLAIMASFFSTMFLFGTFGFTLIIKALLD